MAEKFGRGEHPNSLANLRPAQPGEVRNPEGRNQTTRDREAWEIAHALALAIGREPDEERRAELLERMARFAFDAAVGGDARVLSYFLRFMWPLP